MTGIGNKFSDKMVFSIGFTIQRESALEEMVNTMIPRIARIKQREIVGKVDFKAGAPLSIKT